MSGRVRSRLISFIYMNHRLFSSIPNKEPITVAGQTLTPPHSTIPPTPPPPPLHRTSPPPPTTAGYASEDASDWDISYQRKIPDFDFDEKDMASEKSLWDLYERWIRHWNLSRDLKEKQKHFTAFKESVKFVHKGNKKKNRTSEMELHMFADFKEGFTWFCGEGNVNGYNKGTCKKTPGKGRGGRGSSSSSNKCGQRKP